MDLSPHQHPAAADATPRVTPMMEQYIEIKAANPGALLFYRMGDFYELFFGDAEIASRALGIALDQARQASGRRHPDVRRAGGAVGRISPPPDRPRPPRRRLRADRGSGRGEEARRQVGGAAGRDPPGHARHHHRGDAARAGAGPTSCSPSPRMRASDARSTYRPRLRRHLDRRFRRVRGQRGLRWPARSPASTRARSSSPRRWPPRRRLAALWREVRGRRHACRPRHLRRRQRRAPPRRLFRRRRPSTASAPSRAPRRRRPPPSSPMSSAPRSGSRPALEPPRREGAAHAMAIDAATRANLELTRTSSGERTGSLLDAIDRTVTAPGGRLLAQWLASPLTDVAAHRASARTASPRSSLDGRLRARRARPAARRARPRPRHGAPRPRARRPARSRVPARRPRCRWPRSRRCLAAEPRPAAASRRASGGALARPDRRPRWRASRCPRRRLAADAARWRLRPARLRRRARRDAGPARREPARHRRAAGALCAGRAASASSRSSTTTSSAISSRCRSRRARPSCKPPLRETFVHRQTMAGAMRFSTAELVGLEAAHRLGRRPGAGARTRRSSTALPRRPLADADAIRGRHRRARPRSTSSPALAELAATEDWIAPAGRRRRSPSPSRAAAIRWSRRALKARRQAVHRQ